MKNAHFVWDFIVEDDGAKFAKKAQVGVDLSIAAIQKIEGGAFVFADPGKPKHGTATPVVPTALVDGDRQIVGWSLSPGVYDVTFDQGLKPLPPDCTAVIYQRSTLGRNGSMIRSSIYDPGFTTPKMGAILYVHAPIAIEEHARVAQIVFFENDEVASSDVYGGANHNSQYQGK
jgi:deoxycytidine triphosphate deaminase